jgi:hypothetical protein
MPTADNLIQLAIEAFGIPRVRAERFWHHLRAVGLVPHGRTGRGGGPPEVEPEHAASYLLALSADQAANHAATAALVLGNLPAQWVTAFSADGGMVVAANSEIENIQIPPGAGPDINAVTISLSGIRRFRQGRRTRYGCGGR